LNEIIHQFMHVVHMY